MHLIDGFLSLNIWRYELSIFYVIYCIFWMLKLLVEKLKVKFTLFDDVSNISQGDLVFLNKVLLYS